MRKALRSLLAAVLTALFFLFAALPVSAAEKRPKETPEWIVTIQAWDEDLLQAFSGDKTTCVRRLSKDEIETISDQLCQESRVYLVQLSDGRYTYYMAVDFREDDAVYFGNLDVMRQTSHKLYDRSVNLAKRNAKKSPVLMDYTHIVGELSMHYIIFRMIDTMGGASFKGQLGKLYRSAVVADINIDEARMAALIRIIGLVIGE